MDIIKIINPGIYSSVQDAGRKGYRQFGMPLSGALDLYALESGNHILGNKLGNAVIEITGSGFACEFLSKHRICITGADLSAELDSKKIGIGVMVTAATGSRLVFTGIQRGLRAYLCVSNGIDFKIVMGSRSMMRGEKLKAGDVICSKELYRPAGFYEPDFTYIRNDGRYSIRVRKGPDFKLFSYTDMIGFMNAEFAVGPHYDRMGIRLQPGYVMKRLKKEIVSRPVFPGCIQITGNGNPIIIMNDGQTTGGYPVVAVVTKKELRVAAQIKYGDILRFHYE